MNFSNSSKLRKLLSLTLVLALTAAVFTGCFGGGKEDPTDPPSDGPSLVETNPPAETTTPAETTPVEINENMATVLNELNIRSAPTVESVVVGNLYAGDRVEISRREEIGGTDWAYITTPQAGWIMMEYIKMDVVPEDPAGSNTDTPAGTEETKPAETTSETIKGVINANALNIRKEPNKTSEIVGDYSKGDVVTILEQKNGWGRTDKGWVLMDFVKTGNSTTNTNKDEDKDTTTNTGNGSTTVQFKGIVTASQLNIRKDASTESDRVGSLNFGTRVEILEKKGNWGRIKNGWISLDHVYQDGTTGTKTAKGIVTGDQVNLRGGPGTNYDTVGSVNYGKRVAILEQFTYNGTTWGCTKDGWISMKYIYVDGTGTGEENDETGYITGDQVNIRSGPGTGYDPVGSLNEGDEVTILFKLKVGDTTWGNIKKGWVSMDYVELY